MAGKRKARKNIESGEIPMTPMIDVVFQLLIYFILTMKPVDVSAHLDVFSPSTKTTTDKDEPPPQMLKVEIYQGAILMNGTGLDMPGLTKILGKLAALNPKQTVMILCSVDSKHNDLVEVLDSCAKVGLTNLSVGSMQ
jgi:biopolymer transport protein ExbD